MDREGQVGGLFDILFLAPVCLSGSYRFGCFSSLDLTESDRAVIFVD